jgi:hypothetical protein
MKAYLITTGILFGLIALAHLAQTFAHWQDLSDPHALFAGPGIAAVTAVLSFWAFWLLWSWRRR